MGARYGNGGGHGHRIMVGDDSPLTDTPISKLDKEHVKHVMWRDDRIGGHINAISSKDKNKRAAARKVVSHTVKGELVGAAPGAAAGAMIGRKALKRRFGPVGGTIIGGELGAMAGMVPGGTVGRSRGIRAAEREGLIKAFVPQFKNAFRPLAPPGATKGKTGKLVQARVAETVTDAPKVAAAVGAGSLYAAHKTGTSKRDRVYDPEARRQVRRGVATGSLAMGGSGAVAYGVKGIQRSTKELRELTSPPKVVTGSKERAPWSTDRVPASPDKAAKKTFRARAMKVGHAARGRDLALVTGGTAALGAAGMIQHKAGSNRKRGWS